MKRNLDHHLAIRPLVLVLAVLALAGCGSGAASLTADSASSSTVSPSATPEPLSTSSVTPATVSTDTATVTATTASGSAATTSGDVAAATQSALGLFEKVPRSPQDASAGYVWISATAASAHLSPTVSARLATLRENGYFGDRVCGEDYLTGTQNGLSAAPRILSARRETGGTVTVVIKRPATPAPPDLTVVMTDTKGAWMASDLASGIGPSASIFAVKPHC